MKIQNTSLNLQLFHVSNVYSEFIDKEFLEKCSLFMNRIFIQKGDVWENVENFFSINKMQ